MKDLILAILSKFILKISGEKYEANVFLKRLQKAVQEDRVWSISVFALYQNLIQNMEVFKHYSISDGRNSLAVNHSMNIQEKSQKGFYKLIQ